MAALMVVVWGFAFGMLSIALQSWLFDAALGRLEGMQALFVSVAQASIGSGALAGGMIVDHACVTAALVAGAVAALGTSVAVVLGGRPLATPTLAACCQSA